MLEMAKKEVKKQTMKNTIKMCVKYVVCETRGGSMWNLFKIS